MYSSSSESGEPSNLRHELVETFLNLEQIDLNLFRANHLIAGKSSASRVYGGQVIGQTLAAASRTVPDDLFAHSLHCYFLKPADKSRPIVYHVDRVRDSRSFSTRFVKGVQMGETIFSGEMSFQKVEADSIVHAAPAPAVPPPDECEDAVVFLQRFFNDRSKLSTEGVRAIEAYQRVLDFPTTFDMKIANARQNIQVTIGGPLKAQVWVKAKCPIGDDVRLHHSVAAFISDVTPIGTPIGAHAGAGFRLGMAASLDHSIWIHRCHFRIDDWLLYETESQCAAASRALITGKMWTRDGTLVLSTAQEILVRAEK